MIKEVNMKIKLIHGDCIAEMNNIPDKSIDMILCDLPYGTTKCSWDIIIPFDQLWEQYNRIIKDNGAIVLFGQEPFSSLLRCSNLKDYKYDIYWEKERITNIMQVKRRVGKNIETISVFYKNQCTYNPQMIQGAANHSKGRPKINQNNNYGEYAFVDSKQDGLKYPTSVLTYQKPHPSVALHRTEKPVLLLEYLVKTYTNEGETVLDNCMGSGSTGVACVNTGRNFIGIELDKQYFDIAEKRIGAAERRRQ